MTKTLLFPACAWACAAALACSPRTSDESRSTEHPLASATATPTASPEADLRRKLLATLGGYEHVASREELARLAPEKELVDGLVALYRDGGVHLGTRVQALGGLRFFPTPASKTALETALVAPETADVARHTAVKTYATAFKAEAVPLLEKMLAHPDLHTRNTAARSLGEIGGAPALQAMRGRLAVETEPLVKASLEAAIARAK